MLSGCPARSNSLNGVANLTRATSTWQECGNLCYQEEQLCQVGWTWRDLGEDEGSCALFSKAELVEEEEGIISGARVCPGTIYHL